MIFHTTNRFACGHFRVPENTYKVHRFYRKRDRTRSDYVNEFCRTCQLKRVAEAYRRAPRSRAAARKRDDGHTTDAENMADAPHTYTAIDLHGNPVQVIVSSAMPTPAQPDPLPVAYVIEWTED